MLKHMEKLAELKRAKLLALSLLLIAAALFITTLALPPSPWVGALKAISEAAMVGALADWFAVVALFRRIPLPFVARHTAIIPRNKDRIADNLGRFVEEKFLDTPSLVALIRRYQPALMLGNWFSQPENARRVGQHLHEGRQRQRNSHNDQLRPFQRFSLLHYAYLGLTRVGLHDIFNQGVDRLQVKLTCAALIRRAGANLA